MVEQAHALPPAPPEASIHATSANRASAARTTSNNINKKKKVVHVQADSSAPRARTRAQQARADANARNFIETARAIRTSVDRLNHRFDDLAASQPRGNASPPPPVSSSSSDSTCVQLSPATLNQIERSVTDTLRQLCPTPVPDVNADASRASLSRVVEQLCSTITAQGQQHAETMQGLLQDRATSSENARAMLEGMRNHAQELMTNVTGVLQIGDRSKNELVPVFEQMIMFMQVAKQQHAEQFAQHKAALAATTRIVEIFESRQNALPALPPSPTVNVQLLPPPPAIAAPPAVVNVNIPAGDASNNTILHEFANMMGRSIEYHSHVLEGMQNTVQALHGSTIDHVKQVAQEANASQRLLLGSFMESVDRAIDSKFAASAAPIIQHCMAGLAATREAISNINRPVLRQATSKSRRPGSATREHSQPQAASSMQAKAVSEGGTELQRGPPKHRPERQETNADNDEVSTEEARCTSPAPRNPTNAVDKL